MLEMKGAVEFDGSKQPGLSILNKESFRYARRDDDIRNFAMERSNTETARAVFVKCTKSK
jgi:hypothetical protein